MGKGDGVLIAGANRWSVDLGKMLQSLDIDVVIADDSKFALRRARSEGITIHHGDVLDEASEIVRLSEGDNVL